MGLAEQQVKESLDFAELIIELPTSTFNFSPISTTVKVNRLNLLPTCMSSAFPYLCYPVKLTNWLL